MNKLNPMIEVKVNCSDAQTVSKIISAVLLQSLVTSAYHMEHAESYVDSNKIITAKGYTVYLSCLRMNLDTVIDLIEQTHPHPLPTISWTEINRGHTYSD